MEMNSGTFFSPQKISTQIFFEGKKYDKKLLNDLIDETNRCHCVFK